jgi:hypothetical protein
MKQVHASRLLMCDRLDKFQKVYLRRGVMLSVCWQKPSGKLATSQRIWALFVIFQGVQGVLSPASLTPGEMSNNTLIQRLNGYGGAEVVARYVAMCVLMLMTTHCQFYQRLRLLPQQHLME